jgi:hypothetical protein
MSTIIYTAKAMTGRSGDEMLRESYYNKGFLEARGFEVLDPVLVEGVGFSADPLHNPEEQLREYWKRDKVMIRKAHVLLDVTGSSPSEGKAHEVGYARYCLWKPVVRICPNLGPSVAWFEDDVIVQNLDEAAKVILERWGTAELRIAWRSEMLERCLGKWQQYQLEEFK